MIRPAPPIPALILAVSLPAAVCPGQDVAEEEVEPADVGITFKTSGAIQQLQETNLEGGGEVDITRLDGVLSVDSKIRDDLDLSIRLRYGLDNYDFSGMSNLGTDPWEDIHTLTLNARFQWAMNSRILLFGGPFIQFAREDGADWDDALTGGGFFGATVVQNKKLIWGGGIGITNQIEDDPLFYPIVVLEWKISDRWRLTSRAGPEGITATGIELVYDIGGGWEAGFGGRYEFRRFRLDSSGVAPNGVGEETSVPFWGRISLSVNESFRVEFYNAIALGGELKLDSSTGSPLARADYDPAFIVGIVGRIQF